MKIKSLEVKFHLMKFILIFFSKVNVEKVIDSSVGGNLSKYIEDKILLTIGDYYCYEREKLDFCKKFTSIRQSFMGKIIALDENTKLPDHVYGAQKFSRIIL